MIDRDSTLSSLKALPLSNHPLMDYDSLYVLRHKVLDSVFITPPAGWQAYGPDGDLFQYPIQIVVLGSGDEDNVTLGVYAHPSLQIEQGPEPDQPWRQRWQAAQYSALDAGEPATKPTDEQGPASEPDSACQSTQTTDPDTTFLLDLFDDLYDVTAAYQYFCLTVKPILQSEEHWDTSRKTRHGYALLLDWILERGEALLASLEHRVETRDQAT